MTHAELEPFLGRAVAVRHRAGDEALTGILERDRSRGLDAYRVVSADGEVPPVVLDRSEIAAVDG